MSHKFLKRDTKLINYMAYPRFLTKVKLSETAKLIYILLLDRARLSMTQGGWSDFNGHIYIYYDIKSLADDSGKSIDTVKDVLKALEEADLILREKQPKIGKSRKIYVKTRVEKSPPPSVENSPPSGGENCPDGGEKIDCQAGGFSTPNKSTSPEPDGSKDYSYDKGGSL